MTDNTSLEASEPVMTESERREGLSPVARRALEEADARKAAAAKAAQEALPENERGGPTKVEPTRFGDWERKGIAYDF